MSLIAILYWKKHGFINIQTFMCNKTESIGVCLNVFVCNFKQLWYMVYTARLLFMNIFEIQEDRDLLIEVKYEH